MEPSLAGNVGAVIRVAANFGVRRVTLVRPGVDLDDPEVGRWACGGDDLVLLGRADSLDAAVAGARTVLATASTRGRGSQPTISPREAVAEVARRDPGSTALVFGNESRGLSRADLDRCDLVLRVPTRPEFPVLNLAQAVAIVLAALAGGDSPATASLDPPAPHRSVEGLMEHLRGSLLAIGFLDPSNPDRILRKLRRMLGRAGVTDNEVDILRGVCRQMEWAARHAPGRFPDDDSDRSQG